MERGQSVLKSRIRDGKTDGALSELGGQRGFQALHQQRPDKRCPRFGDETDSRQIFACDDNGNSESEKVLQSSVR